MPNGRVSLDWGDGEHEFNIAKIKEALELEDNCKCGVAEIFERLKSGKWYVNDIRETLRLGLIGGGKEPVKALMLIRRYFDDRPWQESVQTAMIVLMAAMVGVPGDQIGKTADSDSTEKKTAAPAEVVVPSSAPTAVSSAPPSTDLEQASAGAPA